MSTLGINPGVLAGTLVLALAALAFSTWLVIFIAGRLRQAQRAARRATNATQIGPTGNILVLAFWGGGPKITEDDMNRFFPEWTPQPTSGTPSDQQNVSQIGHTAFDETADCCICLAPLLTGPDGKGLPILRTLQPCRHTFHSACISKWLTGKLPRNALDDSSEHSTAAANRPARLPAILRLFRRTAPRYHDHSIPVGTFAYCPICRFDYAQWVRHYDFIQDALRRRDERMAEPQAAAAGARAVWDEIEVEVA